MPNLTAMKEISGFDSQMLVNSTGIDIVTIHLVEQGLVPVHYTNAEAMCQAMEVELKDMFPSVSEIFALADALDSDEEVHELFNEPANRMALRSAGLDPDLRDWIMILDLQSGNERRYRISSMELATIRDRVLSSKDASGYICFYADCQQIIVKKSAIVEIKFVDGASYASFSSRERAYSATMVFDMCSRPETVTLRPDGGEDGNGDAPFSNLMNAALNGHDLPPFFKVCTQDDSEERIVSIHGLEALEIPMGILFPQIYEKDSDARYVGKNSDLDLMDAKGSA